MHSSDVRAWIEAYERSQSERGKPHRELDRLALITRDEDLDECDPELDGPWNRDRAVREEPWPPWPLETATRLALLVGAAMIAALAILFG